VVAYDEANTLWDLLGYYHTSSNNPTIYRDPYVPAPASEEDDNHLDSSEDTAAEDPNRRSLQNALDSSRQLIGLDSQTQAQFNEYSYATACLNFSDQEKMYVYLHMLFSCL